MFALFKYVFISTLTIKPRTNMEENILRNNFSEQIRQ